MVKLLNIDYQIYSVLENVSKTEYQIYIQLLLFGPIA